ncbi:DUF2158 domain-containing protein [Lichenihabitans sp. Uapishka_5]|uniref:YodC family protein n=1 Tax=Lichenihabitans sp. Uapishka_5 TaxID=3037302 RepID=UPI0029E8006D|nr:DUF2158 domain-containing protein [Lichenihabitans sp. Uapishka_5]MDX7950488.1 DUF2158 domain-containing protein [Lichenihabitans sp. Uapishka_5]
MAFKVGDVVRLKSGGPLMTVQVAAAAGGYECAWFNRSDGTYTLAWNAFVEATLQPYPKEAETGAQHFGEGDDDL